MAPPRPTVDLIQWSFFYLEGFYLLNSIKATFLLFPSVQSENSLHNIHITSYENLLIRPEDFSSSQSKKRKIMQLSYLSCLLMTEVSMC